MNVTKAIWMEMISKKKQARFIQDRFFDTYYTTQTKQKIFGTSKVIKNQLCNREIL